MHHLQHRLSGSGGASLRRRPPALLLGGGGGAGAGRRRRPAPFAPLAAAAAANAASSPSPSSPPPAAATPPRALEAAAQLAASRLAESRRPDALFKDPFAELLAHADGAGESATAAPAAAAAAAATAAAAAAASAATAQTTTDLDAIATRYLDECLLNATGATSVTRMARGEDYRQVVLLGDGGDCRPFRLPWPEGTVLFLVAPAEVHERTEALLQQRQQQQQQQHNDEDKPAARVPRGCLLRRVDLDVPALRRAAAAAAAAAADDADADADAGGDASDAAPATDVRTSSTLFLDALARAGFRGDRLSVWGLQGLRGLAPGRAALQALLAEVSSAAAFHSLVAGELPGPLTARDGSNLLADAGLLASVEPPGGAGTSGYGRGLAAPVVGGGGGGAGGGEEGEDRWPRLLFSGQLMRPSLEQMGVYSDHVDAMEGSEEDFGTLHFD